MNKERSNFWRKNFGKLVYIAIWMLGGYISRKNNYLLWKKIISSFSSFLDFWPYFFRTLAEIFQHSLPNCILLVHGRSLSKTLKLGKVISLFIFIKWVRKSGLRSKEAAFSSKLHSRCPEERFEEKSFFEKTDFLNRFRNLTKKLSFLDRKTSGVFWVAFYVSRGTLLGKILFGTD